MPKQNIDHSALTGAAKQVTPEQAATAAVTVTEPGSAEVTTVNFAGVEPTIRPVTVELHHPEVGANAPWRVAIHEAGHACMAFALGHPIKTVDIVPDLDAHRLGECVADSTDIEIDFQEWEEKEHPQRLREKIMRSFAGRIAEEIHLGTEFELVNLEGEFDITTAIELALTLETDEDKATALLVELDESCRRQLGTPSMRHAVRQLAAKLLDTKKLSGAEAKAVFEAALDGFTRKELAAATEAGTDVAVTTDQ